jgi:hypothetical protein
MASTPTNMHWADEVIARIKREDRRFEWILIAAIALIPAVPLLLYFYST